MKSSQVIFPSLTPKKPEFQHTSRIPALFLSREMRNAAYMALCQNGSLAYGKPLNLSESRAFMPGPSSYPLDYFFIMSHISVKAAKHRCAATALTDI